MLHLRIAASVLYIQNAPDQWLAVLAGCRYEMRDVLAIDSVWLTELAGHVYQMVPLNPQMRR